MTPLEESPYATSLPEVQICVISESEREYIILKPLVTGNI